MSQQEGIGEDMSTTSLRSGPELVHPWFRVVVIRLGALGSADVGIGIVHVAHGGLVAVWVGVGVCEAV